MSVFTNTIKINSRSDSAHCGLNPLTGGMHSAGNLLMKPAQYLLNGRSVTYIENHEQTKKISKESVDNEDIFYNFQDVGTSNKKDSFRFVKTAAALVFIIPCSIFGCIFKEIALLCSSKLRQRYTILHQKLETGTLENVVHEMAVKPLSKSHQNSLFSKEDDYTEQDQKSYDKSIELYQSPLRPYKQKNINNHLND